MKSRIKQRRRAITLATVNGWAGRAIAMDNLATVESPVYRKRIVTPLTPRAVRERLLKAANGNRKRLLADLTALDLVVNQEEANALERYSAATQALLRCGGASGFGGVGGGSGPRLPFSPYWQAEFEYLARINRELLPVTRGYLAEFCGQQEHGSTDNGSIAILAWTDIAAVLAQFYARFDDTKCVASTREVRYELKLTDLHGGASNIKQA